MHDAMRSYEADTEVVDVEEPRRSRRSSVADSIARSRVDTGDLTMHVYIDGAWHRLDPYTLDAACGAKVTANSARLHERLYKYPLSRDCGCFTKVEIERADAADRKKFGEP
jgi:hypothetical protein